ncbi:MAG: hypothetical protein QOF69_1883, partial [Solirubrobacteraceae bacterium]|nr:hypothetical protein [Solirubrobacteraceae bacterium]
LCDGDHLEEKEAEQSEVVEAVSTQTTMVPVSVPREGESE